MYQQQYAAHYAPITARRSAIPKVMGILMIIFASLGLIGSLMSLLSNAGGRDAFALIPELKTWSTIELLFSLFGLGIGFLHLIAGAKAVAYKATAPRLAVTYAVVAMVATTLHSVLFYAWAKPIMDRAMDGLGGAIGLFTLAATVIALAWPIIVMILMTRPGAKAACVNEL